MNSQCSPHQAHIGTHRNIQDIRLMGTKKIPDMQRRKGAADRNLDEPGTRLMRLSLIVCSTPGPLRPWSAVSTWVDQPRVAPAKWEVG